MSIFKKSGEKRIDESQEGEFIGQGLHFDPDTLINVIKALAELDIPVQVSIFERDFVARFQTTCQIALKITGNLTAEVPYISPSELERASKRIKSGYKELLVELYELSALLEVMGTIVDTDLEATNKAIEMWQSYLQYAQGHPEQSMRIKIATEHLDRLKSSKLL